VAIGVYLTIARGLAVLLFGLIGVFCSVFYTAPPISFSHHGLGELGQLVSFGTVIGLGSYFVQTQKLTIEAFVATLPLGIMLFSMIVINEIPDYYEDRHAGKLTLVARFGKRNGVKLYVASWICTYSVIICGVLLRVLPFTTLIALVSTFPAFRSIKILGANYEDPVKLAPANLNMIMAHAITSFGLILAYLIQGILNRTDYFELFFILLLLSVLYVPATLALRKPRISEKIKRNN